MNEWMNEKWLYEWVRVYSIMQTITPPRGFAKTQRETYMYHVICFVPCMGMNNSFCRVKELYMFKPVMGKLLLGGFMGGCGRCQWGNLWCVELLHAVGGCCCSLASSTTVPTSSSTSILMEYLCNNSNNAIYSFIYLYIYILVTPVLDGGTWGRLQLRFCGRCQVPVR